MLTMMKMMTMTTMMTVTDDDDDDDRTMTTPDARFPHPAQNIRSNTAKYGQVRSYSSMYTPVYPLYTPVYTLTPHPALTDVLQTGRTGARNGPYRHEAKNRDRWLRPHAKSNR